MNPLWTLAALAVMFYVGLPLLILFSQKMQARPQFVAIDPSNVPLEVTRYFSTVVPELEREGFRVMASLGMPNPAPNVQTFLVMLVHRSAGDKAMVTVVQTTNPNVPILEAAPISIPRRWRRQAFFAMTHRQRKRDCLQSRIRTCFIKSIAG